MGCGSSNQRHSRQRYTPRLSPDERYALQHRVPLCQRALQKLIETIHPELGATLKRLVDASPSSSSAGHEDGDNDSNGDNAALWCPHVGVLYSGGGWRAMTAGAAATDALSQTGILDGVETVAGLSGGSWFVTQWALGGKECNVFHDTEKAEHHPWAYGNVFNPAVHHYDGLKRILSEKVVRRAAKLDRSKITQDLGRFADSLTNTDATFFSLLFLSPGGNSMVTRYASFLEDQLFVWAGASGADEKARLTIENESIKNAISQGTFPTLLCAAIDTVENDAEIAEAQKGKSKNIWCEFLVGAKMFIESRKDFSEKLLLGTALFAAAYHNSGLIEILRDGGVPGNVTEIAHRCNLLDACRVGNDWAVKVILEEVVEGPPDLEAVKIAATRKYDKVLRTLLNDDEATRLFLKSAKEVILEVCGGEEGTGTAVPEAWQILQQRLA